MASYDLKCRQCGKEFEVFVLGFLKDEAKVCPECGSREVEQRYTAFQGVFGGLGAGAPACVEQGRCDPSPRRCPSTAGFS
ncbi:MAG: zinc ribbon domain-containing protein [Thermoleophilia bacterium]|nr:zinc ribbon domain-containing protein [Thermoleophilia bacterium]